ncbi:MAG TPA: tripartite tricarboxylate transporter substrate binding protein [Burkholderiales bacterium]|nr:tripartite tricarboxylate transporter substrate binding protein [Burkholderiales bacterium]
MPHQQGGNALQRVGEIAAIVGGFALSLCTGSGHTQAYPGKPVRLLVGPGAGGPTDALVRVIAAKLSETWGQQIVVENRPGAGNTIAPTIAAKAPADGYTLTQCGISDSIAPALYQKLSYDLLRDFSPISLLGTTPNLLVVHPAVPAKSVHEFIGYAKANPGKVDYGSTGVGISTHLSMELFKTMTGANLVHVPYKSATLLYPDLISGRVSASFGNLPGHVENVRTGRVRALGVSTLKRSQRLPEVPTIAESGVPGFDVTVWYGLCAPAAVPKPILAKLNADVVKTLSMPDLQRRIEILGVDPGSSTPEDFTAFIKSETARWAKVVKDAGIPPQ